MNIKKLKDIAYDLRVKTLKACILNQEAHLGGSYSIIEILVLLYYQVLHKNDKFILSKSHASYPLCIILNDLGYDTKIKTHLEIDLANKIYATTGSLGHGLPIALGMAYARKLNNQKGNIYVLISDGECQEGTTWESLLICKSLKLTNLKVIIDFNELQALEKNKYFDNYKALQNKILSFGLECDVVKNGHCFNKLYEKMTADIVSNVLIINTVKGMGIKSIENDPIWHAKRVKPEMENEFMNNIYRI